MPLCAQTGWPRGANGSLQTSEVAPFGLPARIDDVCFLDCKLHISSGGMLFGVAVNKGRLGFPEIDTALLAVDAQMTYAVRHPSTGVLFYTKIDKKGSTFLYEYYEKKPGKFDTRRVKPYGFSYSVEHPVFSPDGRAMVFASDCPIGFGGRDLWYSEWRDGEWQYPQNLGHRINGEGDETMPALYGDFLVFASSGRSDSYGGSDLYASRLVALEQTGDTVLMYPIGRSAVQSLEAPFCTRNDDYGFTTDGNGNGWWITYDVYDNEQLHSFSGRMDCVKVTGVVSDVAGNIVAGAEVTVSSRQRQESKVHTDSEGRFALFLQPDEEYELACYAVNHFIHRQQIAFSRTKEDLLYGSERFNIVLMAFELGKAYSYDDLFGSPVSSELSPSGRKRMDQMATFLNENKGLKLHIASAYNLSADIPFCALLNKSRLRTLTEYLKGKGVELTAVDTSTTKPLNAADNQDVEALSPTALSSLTVYFTFTD